MKLLSTNKLRMKSTKITWNFKPIFYLHGEIKLHNLPCAWSPVQAGEHVD